MKRIKSNLVPVSIFVLAVISFRLAGVSGRYLTAEVYTRFTRNILFTLALILPVTCDIGIDFAIVAGTMLVQMAMVFSMDLELEGAVVPMFVTGASIVLSIPFGMAVATLLNRVEGREMIVSIMAGQLSSVIYQFTSMVAYGLLIQPRSRDILLGRGTRVRGMVDTRNISSVFKGILPFRFNGKTYSSFPLIIILFFSLVLFYIQRTRLGTLVRAVGTDGGTAGILEIIGSRMHSVRIVVSTIFAAMSQILFVADFGTINIYIGHLGLDTFAAAAILMGGASIKRARMRNCFVGIVLFRVLFITSPMAGQGLSHNPSIGEYFCSFPTYGVIVTAATMNLRSERTKVQSI